jgi:hypothetical protein
MSSVSCIAFIVCCSGGRAKVPAQLDVVISTHTHTLAVRFGAAESEKFLVGLFWPSPGDSAPVWTRRSVAVARSAEPCAVVCYIRVENGGRKVSVS